MAKEERKSVEIEIQKMYVCVHAVPPLYKHIYELYNVYNSIALNAQNKTLCVEPIM